MKEKGPWNNVWGKAGEEIVNHAAFCERFRELRLAGISLPPINPEDHRLPSEQVVLISDNVRPEFQTIAVQVPSEEISTAAAQGRFGYKVGGGLASFCAGIEIVNWTRTSLTFPTDRRPHDIAYNIQFGDESYQQFMAPDFTLYFVLPYGYSHVLASTEARKVIEDQASEPDPTALVVSPPDVSVYFEEWKRRGISNRTVLKLKSQVISDPKALDKMRRVSVRFSIENKHFEWSFQLTIAILLSILFAYGTDFDRIDATKQFFPFQSFVPPDILWLVMSAAILGTIFLPFRADIRSRWERNIINVFVAAAWLSFLIWFLATFWWRPLHLQAQSIPGDRILHIQNLSHATFIVGIAATGYVLIHLVVRNWLILNVARARRAIVKRLGR